VQPTEAVFEHAPVPVPDMPTTTTTIPTPAVPSRQAETPKFLTLPFPKDTHMALLQGWFYDGGGLQQGIDYYRYHDADTVNATNRFSKFPVVAAADGYACGQLDDAVAGQLWQTSGYTRTNCVRGFGHRVFVRHTIEGKTYYTYYGHLDTIADNIPLGDRNNTTFVKRGQFLGYAGNTGTGGGNIHLHFGLLTGGGRWLDPYDIRAKHQHYPDPARPNGLYAGPYHYWTTNPPSWSAEYLDDSNPNGLRPGISEYWQTNADQVRPGPSMRRETQTASPVEGAVYAPGHQTVVGGVVQSSGWASVQGSEINKIEIWIDGILYRTAAYGLPDDNLQHNHAFAWDWDTTQMSNGWHIFQVRAVGLDGSRALLPAAEGDNATTMLVNVQNPHGFVEAPLPDAPMRGIATIRGWASVENSTITQVEIWIDGELRDYATYGLPHEEAGGAYGFAWEWDTRDERDGKHTIQVRAVAEHGGATTLLHYQQAQAQALEEAQPQPGETQVSVRVNNIIRFALDKWNIR
jgi:hypothetical protein